MSKNYSEGALITQPAIALFKDRGYETTNRLYEKRGTCGFTLARETNEDVILVPKLGCAFQRLNPGLDGDAVNLDNEGLTSDRSAMSLIQANHEAYKLLKDGVKVAFQNDARYMPFWS